MTDSLKRWLSLQLDFDSLHTHGAISSFALRTSFCAIILSLATTLLVIPVLHGFSWLPLDFAEAIEFGVGLSWLVCGPVSGMIALLIGHAVCDLAASRAEFMHLSRTDMLSGLLNRRAFAETMGNVDDHASLVIFDLDRFKTINDGYGHAAGDMVIRHVATILGDVFGETHVAARLGGEEFGVLIVGLSPQERVLLAEAARLAIASRPVLFEGQRVLVTISAGIADIWPGRRKQVVYSAADKALYLAKRQGRDRVVHENQHGDKRREDGAPGAGSTAPSIAPADEIYIAEIDGTNFSEQRELRGSAAS
jgi:diguanylate cyclase (GGDEF)-like protein